MTDDQRRTVFRPEQTHPSVWIAPGAVVIGDVALAEDASVWFQAVVRGDTERIVVGRGSNLQDGCVLHADPGFPCTIGERVTVGHLAIVHGATVGDQTMIGMHATVLNGAVIGENSIVAAAALVKEGMQVPPGSLVVGVPARVVRALTPEEIDRNRRIADHYVANARRFAAGSDD